MPLMPTSFNVLFFFFFNDTATTEIYTLSLHDALPICAVDVVRRDAVDDSRSGPGQGHRGGGTSQSARGCLVGTDSFADAVEDRKSTRLNSSHQIISYAVFCLKKKKKPADDYPRL